MLRATCPHCGKKNNHRRSSLGTVKTCKHCGVDYVLSEAQRGLSCGCGSLSLILCLAILIALAAISGKDNQNKESPAQNNLPNEPALIQNNVPLESANDESVATDIQIENSGEETTYSDEDERKAAAKIALAKNAKKDGLITLSKKLLNEVITEFSETPSAKEANELLKLFD